MEYSVDFLNDDDCYYTVKLNNTLHRRKFAGEKVVS
jgi:hypothetical protein